MLEADEVMMKRAIELARRGSGHVSPNPLVGAVLIKDGRLVGEGYHRYDLRKHAEINAIEMAGRQARGSTLYCNLEPCSHYGRTAPCTNSLVEAGIAKAVIAIRDPDRRVNGQGIEQLREAGIEVEVGLCEDQALRLNESYLKFAASGLPFVHAVIECDGTRFGANTEWKPSTEFILEAVESDAVILGSRDELNRWIVETRLADERHRPMVIVLDAQTESELPSVQLDALARGGLIKLELAPNQPPISRPTDGDHLPLRFPQPDADDIESILRALAKLQVTSVLLLRGEVDPVNPRTFEQLDKVTFTVPDAAADELVSGRLAIEDLEFDFEDVSTNRADGYVELTGYPLVRGVA